MSPRQRKYDLPENLTYDKANGVYLWRNPLNNKRTSFKDKKVAIDSANKANSAIAIIKAQNKKDGLITFRFVADMYLENANQTKPWADSTRKNNTFKVEKYKRDFGNRYFRKIDRVFISDYLEQFKKGENYNKHRSLLIDVWTYAISKGHIDFNEAAAVLKRSTSDKIAVNRKTRHRLELAHFWAIYNVSPDFLKRAMTLSLITLQGRSECVNMKIADLRDGWLHVIRQKTSSQSDMAFIKIKSTLDIEKIFSDAKNTGILSPYVVHFKPKSQRSQHIINKPHWTYVMPEYLSKAFSKARKEAGIFEHLESSEKPTFHEIRSLGSRLLKRQGFNEKSISELMTHSDEKVTQIYLNNPENLEDRHYREVETGLRLIDIE